MNSENHERSVVRTINRLKSIRKSDYGMDFQHAMTIFKAVHIPRVTYAARDTWAGTVTGSKSMIKMLKSAHKRPLLAISACLGILGRYDTITPYG